MAKKTLFLVIIVFILGIGAGIGGTMAAQKYLFKNSPAEGNAEAVKSRMVQSGTAADNDGPLVPIGEFTFNLQGGSFLKTAITVEGVNSKSEEFLKSKLAFLKDAINVVLSDKSLADIQTPEAREKLRQDLLFKLNTVTDNKVANVLFESFVYQ
ncbi:MAG TPA: flagellar basal body-associated FliL family protein [Desulfitobacteriaceae bacterium]|nr:flagellar basal body-associated FliL family protein [Desulfitobacteriaceae bacterium]